MCTHGRHDTCCAERGRPVAAALATSFPEETWEASHLGGDRFAANLLVLPAGIGYGRLDAASVTGVAAGHLAGRLSLAHLRGRSGLAMSLQSAEFALREHLDEVALDAVRLRSRAVEGDITTAIFEVRKDPYVVRVRRIRSAASHRLTCAATRENRVTRHVVVAIQAGEAGEGGEQ